MNADVLKQLRTRIPTIHVRWEALLRIERVSGPLANPDSLVHLIPDSLARVLTALARPARAKLSLREAKADRLPACNCGNNPYLAYFLSGEQALVEAVVLVQAELPHTDHAEHDIAEVVHAVRSLAHAEIDTFCGLCAHRGTAHNCRFTANNLSGHH